MSKDKIYIGDGVYVGFDGSGIWICGVGNEIYVNPEVWIELMKFGRDNGMPFLESSSKETS